MPKTKLMINNLAAAQQLEIVCEVVEVVKECLYLGQAAAQRFGIGGDAVDVLTEYNYLGQFVIWDHNLEAEKIRRIRLGWSLFGRPSHILNGILPFSLKKKVYDSCILPVLAYWAKTWRLTKRAQLKLRTTPRAMQRKMTGVTLPGKKRVQYIKEKTRVKDILEKSKKKKWT